ncbi:ferredoxin [Mycolicibacterium sp. A43C]
MRIETDRECCIGAGNCVMTADALFDQDDDGIVVMLAADIPADEEMRARRAAQMCPAGAITVVE